MEQELTPLAEAAVLALDAADEGVMDGSAPDGYDGCRACEVGLVLEVTAARLRAAGHAAAAEWLATGA